MIKEKRLPALRRRSPPPRHVFGYAGLAYIDPDLEQLTLGSDAVDLWRGAEEVFKQNPAYWGAK
jgi:hypothetical protein